MDLRELVNFKCAIFIEYLILVIVSSPPGYFPNNLVATTPSYLPKTSTPYFTEILIPKRPLTKHSNDPNREYSPRVPTTTQRPQQTTQPNPNYQDGANSADYVNQRVSYGSFGRTKPTSSVVYDPNVKLNNSSYFTSARDRSQHNLNAPSIRLPERQGYKVPNARFKVYGRFLLEEILKSERNIKADFFLKKWYFVFLVDVKNRIYNPQRGIKNAWFVRRKTTCVKGENRFFRKRFFDFATHCILSGTPMLF